MRVRDVRDGTAARPGSKSSVQVLSIEAGHADLRPDELATEEPLEIRIIAGGERRPLAVTMRTPGQDFELAAGFLHAEGVIASRDDIARISYCVDPDIDAEQQYNIVNVTLRSGVMPDLAPLERHVFTSSACGVCGRASLDALMERGCVAVPSGPEVAIETLWQLPETLREAQRIFGRTGGLHAAALFTADGTLLTVREDVGRHNALDKLVGWALLEGRLPLHGCILLLSGRSSFELLQKSAVAGIPIVASVSAPSSLAVETARRFGITLIGFLRGERCNVYSGRERVLLEGPA
ncbi:MAG: formate dehydrogenase accessory sulfurtransferase FdhD [Thermomicrobiales bacterium]